MQHRVLVVSSLAIALVATPVFAQQSLDQIVVTGTRTPQGPQTLAAHSVITREDIDRLQPASLQELLRGQAGIAIYNQGGEGKLSGIFLRGTGSGQVLVLVDGVKIGTASAGMAMLQDIPVSQIERVEIVRGPMSGLYGSEAVGGVIQVFTRRPKHGVDANASMNVGSHDTWGASAGIGMKRDNAWANAQLAYRRTRGFDACSGDPVTWSGCGVIEPDRDGYYNRSLKLGGGMNFGDAWSVEANALRAASHNQFDGSFSNHGHGVQQVVGGQVRYAPNDALALTLRAGQNRDEATSDWKGQPRGFVDSRRDTGGLQADFGSKTNLLSLGVDAQREQLRSSTRFDRTSRRTNGVFGQWQGEFGAHQLQLGLRRDDDSQYGAHNTGHLGWGWQLHEAVQLVARGGTAFRAPTFNDLYYPGFSNPTLRPETSRSLELGFEGTPGWGRWSLRGYQTSLTDLIFYNPLKTSPQSPYGMPDNVQRARIRGVEGEVGLSLAGWEVRANANWTDPRNRTAGVYDGLLLNRRPQLTGRVDADRTFGAFRLGASINGSSHRFDDPANKVRMAGYGTTDLRIAYLPSADWTLQFNVGNVFDRQYETTRWYRQAGRTYGLTVSWTPAN